MTLPDGLNLMGCWSYFEAFKYSTCGISKIIREI